MLPRWLRGSGSDTHPRGAESLARDVPAGESRAWPAWPGAQCQHCTVGTWCCPDRDPSMENYLVPLPLHSYKPHFLLALLSRSPLPPPFHSFCPHPPILTCWWMGGVVCMVAQIPMGLWPCLKFSPAPAAQQFCKPAPGRQEGPFLSSCPKESQGGRQKGEF